MSAVLYPIADNAEAALSRPQGRAARAAEAGALAGGRVVFAQEMAGPAFDSREAALDAFAGRLDDERPGRAAPAPEDRYCVLREVLAGAPPPPGKGAIPLKPANRRGRRWPAARSAPRTVWRLSISYWRLVAEAPAAPVDPPVEAGVAALRARLERPMRPVKPQQPLDIGLFEVRPPEAPHILMPDE